MTGTALIEFCDHMSESGAEGPVDDLGRWPVMWKCDHCGNIRLGRNY